MTQDDREALVRSLLPLLRATARRIKRLVPGADLDDLIGDGSVGLVRAVDAYDPQRGTSLAHFAGRVMLGTMLNGIRRMDPVSERVRRIVREGEKQRFTVAVIRGEIPCTAETERNIPGFARAKAKAHWGAPLSLDATLPEGETMRAHWGVDPAQLAIRSCERRALHAAIDELPERQRKIVVMHYFGERSLRAIGRTMEISSQRTSQLHLAAIERLRKAARAATG